MNAKQALVWERWVVCPTPAAVAEQAADRFCQWARQAINERGTFAVALSGGSTPAALHRLLAAEPHRNQIDWSRVEIFFGDERCVPPDHVDSNYRAARETLLDHVPLRADNIHRMQGENDPQAGAIAYGRLLRDRFGEGGLDLALLGMGDDGHTASLFPGSPALNEPHHRCVAQFVPNSTTGPSWRITLTAPFLNRSRQVLALVTGAGKAQRLKEVLEGPFDPQRLPIQLIQPGAERMIWLMDSAAAACTHFPPKPV
jgi:6-phosphogluconolactonase